MACYPVFKFDLQHLSTSGRLAHWRTVFLDGNRKSCGTRHRTAIHRSTSTYQMAQRHLCGQTKIGWYTHRKQTCRKQHSRIGNWNRPQHPGNCIPDGLTSTSGIVQTIESASGFLLFGHHPAYTTIYDALPSYAQTRSTRIVAAKV